LLPLIKLISTNGPDLLVNVSEALGQCAKDKGSISRNSTSAKSFFLIFCGQCLYFSFRTNNAYEGILYTTALLCFPKNLIPWRVSNPGLLVPEADSMSTAPRRQGVGQKDLRTNFFSTKFEKIFVQTQQTKMCI
jgi:hypothetical protein